MREFSIYQPIILFKVSVVKTFETFAVASLILCHLVNSVVDSVEVKFLGTLRNAVLVAVSLISELVVIVDNISLSFSYCTFTHPLSNPLCVLE